MLTIRPSKTRARDANWSPQEELDSFRGEVGPAAHKLLSSSKTLPLNQSTATYCVCVMIWFHAQRSRWLVFRRERSSDVRVTARRRDLHNFRQAVKQEMTWPRNMKQSTSGTSKSHHGSSWNLNSITLHSSTELARSTWLRCLSNSS